ncbi:MAG: protoporphyrinogen oxidase [Ignavibacteriales bacterium]|nr:MAG: protoporphyrinogen oxidase [Ignavibacteriales bacterium]
MKSKIVIIGAGISGVATAFLLNKLGYDITILEKKKEPGGSIETVFENGFVFDKGPNSALETTPLIGQIVMELGLTEQLVYANKEANKRYILKNNQLHPLPMSPPAFLKTKLFSPAAKLRLMAEPFIGRSKDGYYQSISEFVTRRLGREFLDYAINPFVAGVYAGNPEELSVKSAFPKLYELEEKYGGLITGTVRSIRERKKRAEKSKQSAKMLSFKDGMQVLPKTIVKHLGNKVKLECEVTSIQKTEKGFQVNFIQNGTQQTIDCNKIISTIPAYIAVDLFSHFDDGLAKHFNEIYYPPVLVLFLVYKKEDIKRPLDGFGFLIPSKEKKSFLGAIWSSVIFPNRSDYDKASFTLFVGGARNPEIRSIDKEILIGKVKKEFEDIMKISGTPELQTYKYWSKAIPQYNIGYIEHERYFDEFEKKNPGIILSGNYRGGISVGDCIKNAEVLCQRIISNL